MRQQSRNARDGEARCGSRRYSFNTVPPGWCAGPWHPGKDFGNDHGGTAVRAEVGVFRDCRRTGAVICCASHIATFRRWHRIEQAAQTLWVGANGQQCLRGRTEQDGIDNSLVLLRQCGDRCRQCEDHMVVVGRQQLGLAGLQPAPGGTGLTLPAGRCLLARCRLDLAVSEQCLDNPDIDPVFQQVRGIGMP